MESALMTYPDVFGIRKLSAQHLGDLGLTDARLSDHIDDRSFSINSFIDLKF